MRLTTRGNKVHIMNGERKTWCGRDRMDWMWDPLEDDYRSSIAVVIARFGDELCLRCEQLHGYAQARREVR